MARKKTVAVLRIKKKLRKPRTPIRPSQKHADKKKYSRKAKHPARQKIETDGS